MSFTLPETTPSVRTFQNTSLLETLLSEKEGFETLLSPPQRVPLPNTPPSVQKSDEIGGFADELTSVIDSEVISKGEKRKAL